jgi:hypothetical protein
VLVGKLKKDCRGTIAPSDYGTALDGWAPPRMSEAGWDRFFALHLEREKKLISIVKETV